MTNDQQDRAYRLAQIAATLMAADYDIDGAMRHAYSILIRSEAQVRDEIKAEASKRLLPPGPTAEETPPASERPRPVLQWDGEYLRISSSATAVGAAFWSVPGKCWVASWLDTRMDQDTEAKARARVEAQARAAGFDVEGS